MQSAIISYHCSPMPEDTADGSRSFNSDTIIYMHLALQIPDAANLFQPELLMPLHYIL